MRTPFIAPAILSATFTSYWTTADADATRPDNQRRTAILHYTSWAAVFPISGLSGYLFGCGHFDQSRERRDGPSSGRSATLDTMSQATGSGTQSRQAELQLD